VCSLVSISTHNEELVYIKQLLLYKWQSNKESGLYSYVEHWSTKLQLTLQMDELDHHM
jgi:hypothetical protein